MILSLLLALVPGFQDVPTPDEIHDYVDLMLIELGEGKVDLITDVMQLDEDQGATFWNLYQEYEIELYQLGDRRLELLEEFREAVRGTGLTDELAGDIAARFFVLKKERAALIEKYHATLSAELSPITAAQFVQLESRFNMMIDLLFAADTPLIVVGEPLDRSLPEGDLAESVDDTSAREIPPALWLCLALALYFGGAIIYDMRTKRSPTGVLQWGVLFVVAVAACALLW